MTALVERGVDFLIYNGKYDWTCNWLSNQAYLDKLDWSGSSEYLKQDMRPWHVKTDGKSRMAGETKSALSLGGGRLSESHKLSNAVAFADVIE